MLDKKLLDFSEIRPNCGYCFKFADICKCKRSIKESERQLDHKDKLRGIKNETGRI